MAGAGFLGLYGGTEFVDALTGAHADAHDGFDWWIEIKRCLPQVDYDAASDALTGRLDLTGRTGVEQMDMKAVADPTAYQRELVARSVVSWNLTDQDELPLATGRIEDHMPPAERMAAVAVTKASLDILPHEVFLRLYTRVNELNTPAEALAKAQFPGVARNGDKPGDVRAADPEPVRA